MKNENKKGQVLSDLWLIRKTNERKILGPMTGSVIQGMLEGDLLRPEDEIIQGNGYWIKIKEKDLIHKHLYENTPTGYHPCSLIMENLTPPVPLEVIDWDKEKEVTEKQASGHGEEGKEQKILDSKGKLILIPSKQDLEYPKI